MTPGAPLPLAIGFGNLLMLGWLGAAAAPLIIHLWNKRKYREVSWAAVEFLLAAMRKNARRVQLQQWLLLAVRTLLIVLVVLAVAEPFLERAGLSFVAGKRTHKLLVLDGSFSMDYRPTDISRFTRSKQIAAQIVEQSRQGDGFTLVLMSAPPRIVVGTPAMEPRDFLEELESLKPPQGGADLAATLGLVDEVLERARREVPGLEHHEVFFLTDLGRNTWAPDAANPTGKDDDAAGSASVPQHVEHLAKIAALSIVDLGQAGSQNLAVTSLTPLESFATVARDVTLEAQVRNFGNQARSRQLVELLVDGARVKEEYVDLEPGAQATLGFSHRFETPGQHVIQVRLAADLLAVDNQRWLSLEVKDHLRVLCVGGQEGSTRYVANALDPERDQGGDRSLVRPQIVPESELVELDLDQFDCIFLCNVGQFTAVEARLLDAYLRQGGGLVFFLGDRVLAERYNRELAGEGENGVRVLPVRLGPIMAEAQYQFDPLDYRHPIVNIFRGSEQSGLLSSPVTRYFKLIRPEEWTRSRVALAFAGGDPAIVEEPIHRGRSIVVALPASLDSVDPVTHTPWTMMPVWPSFPPIVQELLATAVSSQTAQFNAIVGEPLGRPVATAAAGSALTIALPDGRKQPVRFHSDTDETQWSFSGTDDSGIYTAQFDAPAASEVFAVNVDTAESDLTKAEPDELPREFTVKTDWQNLDQQPAEEIGRRSGLHRLLLYAGLVLLLAEPCLAWWFSRGSA